MRESCICCLRQAKQIACSERVWHHSSENMRDFNQSIFFVHCNLLHVATRKLKKIWNNWLAVFGIAIEGQTWGNVLCKFIPLESKMRMHSDAESFKIGMSRSLTSELMSSWVHFWRCPELLLSFMGFPRFPNQDTKNAGIEEETQFTRRDKTFHWGRWKETRSGIKLWNKHYWKHVCLIKWSL